MSVTGANSRRSLALLAGALLLPLVTLAGLEFSAELLQRVREQFGAAAEHRVLAWQELLHQTRDSRPEEQLQQVNAFFNRVRFVSDEEHWSQRDYWATPLELLATDGGDCEDYSIAKYFTLVEAGMPEEHLRITYVKATELDQAHMVLAYYERPDAEPLILDNLRDDILPASERRDLVPVYSFNGSGLWLSVMRGTGQRVGDSRRIRLWKQLLLRMQWQQSRQEP